MKREETHASRITHHVSSVNSFLKHAEVYEFLEILERTAIKVKGELQLQVIKADPDDDKFIIAAVEGGADYIVSGDSHLKELKEYQGIKIVTPAQFVRILENLEN
ncbi:PIN domain-containing protein [Candidatus Poribacteria bacterium]|nr:PIN domain-containing protein [Candidatus Poribacteria bacterium]